MAQLTYVGQGQQAALGPLASSIMLLMSLVLALLGIKIWGFRRRLTFDSNSSSSGRSSTRTAQQQPQTAPRYAAYESQVNGTDNAVHGVFRQRNTEEFESAGPTNSTAKKYLAVSVPNLQLNSLAPYEYKEETSIPELSVPTTRRQQPEAARRRRHREARSSSYDYYLAPPTRQPPAPPIALEAAEPPSQLDIPDFDHFAEKYKLISVKATSDEAKETNISEITTKERGRYIKYEQVDDVPELLTPDDDQVGAAISVAAQVHQSATVAQRNSLLKPEPEPETEPEPQPKIDSKLEPQSKRDVEPLELEHTESAFVVEIIAGTPESADQTEPVIARNLFADLELPHHVDDVEFERIRSSYEMNEADILDMQADFTGLQNELPAPGSPPGFGKTIDDDWENFENLESVATAGQRSWSMIELPRTERSKIASDLENVVREDSLFRQLELMTPSNEIRAQRAANTSEPPPYDMRSPASPNLPDYESLMQLEVSRTNRKLPNYEDVVGKGSTPKYVSSIEDMFVELQVNGNSPPPDTEVNDFEKLCEELDIPPLPMPAPRTPQPAPRVSKPTTLSVRGHAAPLNCYEPEELPSSSSSEEELEQIAAPPPPQPAKRKARTLKVRFDVENLQYYQSAEVPSSTESDTEFDSAEDQSERETLPPRATQRLITLLPEEPESPNAERDGSVPKLFSSQISQEDSDDELFGRAIRQHRLMTEALRPVAGIDHTTQSERTTEA
ncbi:PREDICTED: actin cytoskeleton-regulatory complex protein PAN1 [Drosophila arizonae]|uniref:Actin cytoskeleton-regulatory complex protein PAN1 n=1 Tax=Drosophila arizonae TaxID=7263 RepID=A0ABM1P944_DROAR|nr:PREDICTED: actin cytoskeleton-regulatory complex protein PAN1 [Drosophila arizonae]